MSAKSYWLSTALTLQVNEILILTDLKKENHSINEIKNMVLEENILQKEKLTTIKRQLSDYLKRLDNMDESYIMVLDNLDYTNKKYFLFANLLETYPMLLDFMVEVVLQKILMFNYALNDSDFFNFLNVKENEIENSYFSENSRYKLKQVTFRILSQAGIVYNDKKIQKPYLNLNIINYYKQKNKNILNGLLMSNSEISEVAF